MASNKVSLSPGGQELCRSRKKKRQLQTIAEELINDANVLAKGGEKENSVSLLVKLEEKRKAIEDEGKNIRLVFYKRN